MTILTDLLETGRQSLSFTLCLWVPPGLLLLCVVASEVWDAETKSIEFVCNRVARRALNIVPEMNNALLPCTELHIASWENKSVRWHEKRGDIVASLRLLNEGVKGVRALRQAGCEATLLQRLENNINNYLLILTHLQLSVRSSHSDKLTVLLSYSQLISGKLEHLMVNLEDGCTSQ
uniref:Thrombopoietin n=1 Tax=Stegastes partitus TaxID=144197 RepID=A0A3B5A222_9TELE